MKAWQRRLRNRAAVDLGACICIHIHIHMYICIHLYVYVYTYMYMYIYIDVLMLYSYSCMGAFGLDLLPHRNPLKDSGRLVRKHIRPPQAVKRTPRPRRRAWRLQPILPCGDVLDADDRAQYYPKLEFRFRIWLGWDLQEPK